MKISIKIPGMTLYPGTGRHWWESITSEQIVAIAKRCEALGFDHVSISDHIVMNRESAPEMGARWVHSLSAAGFGRRLRPRRDEPDHRRPARRRPVPQPDRAGEGPVDAGLPVRGAAGPAPARRLQAVGVRAGRREL